ncbi:MAG TPA: DUF4404 family protein [Pirellulales bacterium]|nr:DUF4404 family protein [Pirellulales bacterium]
MPVDREKLTATLNELLSELSDVDRLDPEEEIRLRTALAEIQTVLEKKQSPPPAMASRPGGSIDRLREAALRLEESHPALSTAIGNFAGVLGQMGF